MTDSTAQALTTEEIRANAGKWTLAADVGLLAHLKQFSEEIIQKTEVTESSLNNLLDQVEETCTNFNNVSNQFLSLQNSQFLENRVYDDETPTEEKERPPQPVEETQQQTLEKYKEAVSVGLGLLDSHFEEVVLLESSDSDEETSDSNPALVLRAKTQYTKPLPLIIGSAEWWADDNVGLGEFQENEDSEPEVTPSDSEPNVTRPQVEKRLIRTLSSSSSASSIEEEVPRMKKPNIPAIITIPVLDEPPVLPTNDEDETEDMFKPVDDLFSYAQERSLFGAKMFESPGDIFPTAPKPEPKTEDLFAKEVVSDPLASNDVQSKPANNRVSNAFTKELAAKLGTVARNQSVEKTANDTNIPEGKEPEKKTPGLFDEFVPPVPKTRTAKPPPETKATKSAGLFGEQDEDDDLFSGRNVQIKKTSRLFEDDEDDDLFGSAKKVNPVGVNKQRGSSTYESITKPAASASSNLFSGFEDDLGDDHNLFAPKSVSKIFPSVKPSAGSANNSPLNNNMDGPKTSTPALQGTPAVPSDPDPPDDLFGSISRVGNDSRNQSQRSEPSHEDSQIAANPADVGMMNDTRDDSRDLGFIETSSLGEGDASKKDSPANWFHPQLSSTHAVGSSHETSGYKTATAWTGGESAGADSRSDSKPLEKRFSSILEDNSPASKRKSSTKGDDLFSGSRKSSNWRDDESDDLFSSKPGKSAPVDQSRHVKIESDLFESTDDLFATQPKTVDKKADDLVPVKTTSWKPSLIFDDDEDGLFDDGKNKLSVSSSRSSLFEEPGRSNLPAVFANKQGGDNKKLSLFEDVDDDFDLFGRGEKKGDGDSGELGYPEKAGKNSSRLTQSSKPVTADLVKKPVGEVAASRKVEIEPDLFAGNDDSLFGGKSEVSKTTKPSQAVAGKSEEPAKPKPPSSLPVTKASDLLKDEPDGEIARNSRKEESGSDDLFGKSQPQKPASFLPVISEELKKPDNKIPSLSKVEIKPDLLAGNDDSLFGEKPEASKTTKPSQAVAGKSEEPAKPKPPSSLPVTKASDLLKDEPDGETARNSRKGEPGSDDLFGKSQPPKPASFLPATSNLLKKPDNKIPTLSKVENRPDSFPGNDDSLFGGNPEASKTTKPSQAVGGKSEEPAKPKPPSSLPVTKASDLLKDEPDGEIARNSRKEESGSDDLFGKSQPQKPASFLPVTSDLLKKPDNKIPTSRKVEIEPNLLAGNDNSLFGGNPEASKIAKPSQILAGKPEETAKPKPPSSLPVTKASDLLKDEPDGEIARISRKGEPGSDDLFGKSQPPKPASFLPVISEELKKPDNKIPSLSKVEIKPDLLAGNVDSLFGGKPEASKTTKPSQAVAGKSEEPAKPKPPSSLPVTKASDLLKDEPDGEIARNSRKGEPGSDDLFGKSQPPKPALFLPVTSDLLKKPDNKIPTSRKVEIEPNLLAGNDNSLFGGNPEASKIAKPSQILAGKPEETAKPKPPSSLPVTKASDLLKDEPDGEIARISRKGEPGSDDLFGKSQPPKPASFLPATSNLLKKPDNKIPTLSKVENRPDSFPGNDDSLFGGNPEASKTTKPSQAVAGKSEEPAKPKPPSSLPVTKVSDLLKNEPEVKQAVSKKIGKLNIPTSLKINPAALLPGSRPGKVEIPEPALDILTSAARDRPRIRVKRRPQTRKARHEALRHSGIDFGADAGNDLEENFTSPASDKESLYHSVESSPSPAFVSADVVSPSTDEDDCLSFPDMDLSEKGEQNIFKNDVDDDLLFGGAPVISPGIAEPLAAKKYPENIPKTSDKTAIFSQDVEDEDLFGASVPVGSSSLFDDVKVPKVLNQPIAGKSLFGDDDDEDDIFSGKASKPAVASLAKKQASEPVLSVSSKSKVNKKVKEPFVDPLGLLHE